MIDFQPIKGPFDVPESMRVSVDLRNGEDDLIAASDKKMEAELDEVATILRAKITSRRKQRIAPVGFHEGVRAAMFKAQRALGLPSEVEVVMAAGHDCCNIAFSAPSTIPGLRTRVPCAMLAVQSVGGISHDIEELTHTEDLQRAGDVLLRTLLALCQGDADGTWQSPPPHIHNQALEMHWDGRMTAG